MKETTKPKRLAMRSPRDMCSIGAPRKSKAALVFREVVPGKLVACFPDYEVGIRDSIKRMRRDARRAIKAVGNNPKRAARMIIDAENAGRCDRAYFAASLYEQLAQAERSLSNLLKCLPENAIWCGLKFAAELEYCRFLWDQLRLVEDERYIDHGMKASRGLAKKRSAVNADRHASRSREWERWNDEAGKIWGSRPQLSKQAAAERIKTRFELNEVPATIAKKLKKPRTAC